MGKGKRNKKRKPMGNSEIKKLRSSSSNTYILIAITVIAAVAVIYFSS